ncbi:MAG: Fe-Mn family superoxide dismutase [Bacilli bacterium]|nr:Fe-Mn family superoxide dismutase [Bacilli bacterium]CDD22267.1 superoxide dismutase [Firmicutes bacterium CAG:313]
MSLTNHYPFATIPLNYNLTSFEDFLDFQTLSIHYNQIYKEFVDDLNFILSTEISLQKLTLDEILFNEKILSPFRKNDIIKYAGGVYNHQIVFRSITPNPIVSICPELKKAIENKYKTMRDFYLEFKKACLAMTTCGYVFLVCDEKCQVSIKTVYGNDTTVPDNLCPILGIDMFEHAYYLKYKHNVKEYVENWFKYICFEYANNQYKECLKIVNSNI